MTRSLRRLPPLLSSIVFLSILASSLGARQFPPDGDGTRAESINGLLDRFHGDPKTAMNEPPPRWDENGGIIDPEAPGNSHFPREAIMSGAAIAERDRLRSRMCMQWEGKSKCLGENSDPEFRPHSVIRGVDLPEALADNGAAGLVRTLEKLEELGIRRAEVPTQPWSDDHWAHFVGILGARYADRDFPLAAWLENFRYIQTYPASDIASEGSDAEVDLLSPSEKYELLIGDGQFSMTGNMWSRGKKAHEETGWVERWMGICHGWAQAAIMMPRPARTVSLVAADGRRELRFYPSDIKALASLLWAEGRANFRFVGGRCKVQSPETDESGRVTSDDCFDTNPGTWHLAVTNQIGVSRRGFILDSTFDYQVWNQPVVSYSYEYFNPQMKKYVPSLRQARVPMDGFSRDPFRKYRSDQAKAVVGVAMDVTYAVTTTATHKSTDSPRDDGLRTVRYLYDLELDDSGTIIGGEWYTNLHPDFLWVPPPGTRAVSDFESEATGEWEAGNPLPASWQNAARNAAPRAQPLARIVEAIIGLSSPEQPE